MPIITPNLNTPTARQTQNAKYESRTTSYFAQPLAATNSNDKNLNAPNFTQASSNQCFTVMPFEKRALKTRSCWIVVQIKKIVKYRGKAFATKLLRLRLFSTKYHII
ncbi:hypothetical protein [Candidatus Kuenenia stuttgartiensis]|jgi:hypothetical protein|nr:hypothetical protein [Candidatus Kuenenia stuttgartiensis]TVM02319.1 MAG: hypothetical protein CV080_01205 [Candidatus Kuenenia stuttgartiensis]